MRRWVMWLSILGLSAGCATPRIEVGEADWSRTCTWHASGEHTEGALFTEPSMATGLNGATNVRWSQTAGYTRVSIDGFGRFIHSLYISVEPVGSEVWLADPGAERSRSIEDYQSMFLLRGDQATVSSRRLIEHRRENETTLHFVVATPEAHPWDLCIEARLRD